MAASTFTRTTQVVVLIALAIGPEKVRAQSPQIPRQPIDRYQTARRLPYQPPVAQAPATGNQPAAQVWSPKRLNQIRLRPDSILPGVQSGMPRRWFNAPDPLIQDMWAETAFHWKSPLICHRPLYFDDQALERYGQQRHPMIQPWLSGARFFITFPAVPYQMGVHHPGYCVCNTGYFRPGNCAPQMEYTLPWDRTGAFFESGAWLGAVFLLP